MDTAAKSHDEVISMIKTILIDETTLPNATSALGCRCGCEAPAAADGAYSVATAIVQ
jgi:hypothetical protein